MTQEQKDAIVQAILFLAELDCEGAEAALKTEFTSEQSAKLYNFLFHDPIMDNIQDDIKKLKANTDWFFTWL